ncbi:MAG: NUDIX domain-containing protein [Myxococcales bacterium]|nr:NUDIX domain-containing protein [Myxococcales bacterium]
MPPRYTHCSSCGVVYAQLSWPRRCASCGELAFRNPTPVAVLLQPVLREPDAVPGLLVIRRADAPRPGALALPGGFVEFGEAWRHAACREAWEEASFRADPDSVTPFGIESAGEGVVLLFGLARPILVESLPPFVPNVEVSERLIIDAPIELVFPLHTAAASRWFAGRAGG